jgi:hypothetical protein
LTLSPSSARAADKDRICQNQTIRFEKADTPIFPETSDYALDQSSSNRTGEPRHGSLIILYEVLSKVYQQVVHDNQQRML